MSERLLGKVCIITGTGGSIGREAALTFAREGALVVGCGLQVDDAEATDCPFALSQSSSFFRLMKQPDSPIMREESQEKRKELRSFHPAR